MQKYNFLPFAARVLKVVGWIVLVVGVIGSIIVGILFGEILNILNGATAGMAATGMGILAAIVGIIGSFLAWVFLLATSELFYLFMDVEENTRNTAERIIKESE